MNFIYGTCIIIFMLNEYINGSSDEEPTGNIMSLDESERDTETDNKLAESDAGSDVDAPDTTAVKLNVIHDTERVYIYQWHKGMIPYFIETKIYDDIIVDRIRRVMDHIESTSCLLFKQLHSEPSPSDYGVNWLHITNPDKERDCVHRITPGNLGQPMMIVGFDCMRETQIMHTLLHMLGFHDEIQHPHRDQYVRVLWDNIQPKYRSLFSLRNDPMPYRTLTEYDTLSIMHFHDRAFSINGGATIAALIPGLLIDPSDKLSLLDKMKLRLAFGHECNKRKVDNLFMTCKNSLLEEGNVNDGIPDGGSDGGAASDSNGGTGKGGSDKGTASGNDKGTASGSDRGIASGSDRGIASGSDGGIASGSDGGTAGGSDGGTASGSDRGTVSGSDAGSAKGSDIEITSGSDKGSIKDSDGGSASGSDKGSIKDSDGSSGSGSDKGSIKDSDGSSGSGSDKGSIKDSDGSSGSGTDKGSIKDSDGSSGSGSDKGSIKNSDGSSGSGSDKGSIKDSDGSSGSGSDKGSIKDSDGSSGSGSDKDSIKDSDGGSASGNDERTATKRLIWPYTRWDEMGYGPFIPYS